jgi:hypothetical protein
MELKTRFEKGTYFMSYQERKTPTYAELVKECERWDICRTKAFDYARRGLIDTFVMGRKRYVVIASLESLPERLRAAQGGVA